MTLNVTIDLPEAVQRQMEEAAQSEHRSIAELIRDLVIQNWQQLPRLPDDVEAELAALDDLSDEVLWLLARSTMTNGEQAEMAHLNDKAQHTSLTSLDEERLSTLMDAYDRTMIRRAQAAALLQKRGYHLKNPAILQS